MNLRTTLPTAAEAVLKVSNGEYEKAQNQLSEIEKQINSAISGGRRSVSFGDIEPAVKNKLVSLGYKISSGQQYNET